MNAIRDSDVIATIILFVNLLKSRVHWFELFLQCNDFCCPILLLFEVSCFFPKDVKFVAIMDEFSSSFCYSRIQLRVMMLLQVQP